MKNDPKMTFVSSCRLQGRKLFILERFTMTLDEAEVVHEENGPIAAFLSEAEARAEIAQKFRLPRVPISEKSSMEELAGAMEDQYTGKFTFSYDLDAAREWAREPGPTGLSPREALQVWELLFLVGEAPRPQRFDPMKMYAMQENITKDEQNRDWYEVVLLGMKLSGIVIMSQEARREPDWNMEVPEMAEIWPSTDYARLGAILLKGIEAFERRIL